MKKIQMRKAIVLDAREIAEIHVKVWQESYKGIIEQSYLDNISLKKRLEARTEMLSNPGLNFICLIALHNKNIVGFCDVGPSLEKSLEYKGELYALYLLSDYKRQGIGTALFKKAQQHLIQHNLLPFIIWVLKENRVGCKFYEVQEGVIFKDKLKLIGGKSYILRGYIFNSSKKVYTLHPRKGKVNIQEMEHPS